MGENPLLSAQFIHVVLRIRRSFLVKLRVRLLIMVAHVMIERFVEAQLRGRSRTKMVNALIMALIAPMSHFSHSSECP